MIADTFPFSGDGDTVYEPLRCYQLTTVPFSLRSSPFLAIRYLHESVNLETGGNNKDEVISKRNQLILTLKKYDFELSQWAANDSDLLLSH